MPSPETKSGSEIRWDIKQINCELWGGSGYVTLSEINWLANEFTNKISLMVYCMSLSVKMRILLQLQCLYTKKLIGISGARRAGGIRIIVTPRSFSSPNKKPDLHRSVCASGCCCFACACSRRLSEWENLKLFHFNSMSTHLLSHQLPTSSYAMVPIQALTLLPSIEEIVMPKPYGQISPQILTDP